MWKEIIELSISQFQSHSQKRPISPDQILEIVSILGVRKNTFGNIC